MEFVVIMICGVILKDFVWCFEDIWNIVFFFIFYFWYFLFIKVKNIVYGYIFLFEEK